MKKHAGYQGKGCRHHKGFLRKRSVTEDNGRDGTVLKCEELGSRLREIHLIEKHSDADADEEDRDDGGPLSRIIVLEWNHVSPALWNEAAIRDRTRESGIGRRSSVAFEWNGKPSGMSMASASE